MSKKKEIIKQVGLYSVATQATQCITFFSAIMTRNFLEPSQMGIWTLMQVVLQYASYATLGTTQGIAREIPYYIGKKEMKTADSLKNQVVSFQMMTGILAAAGIFIAAFICRSKTSPIIFWGLLTVSLLVILQRANNLLISLLRAYKQFETISHQMTLSAIVNVALVFAFAYPFKVYGLMIATVLSFIFNIAYVYYRYALPFKYELNKKLLSVISFGLPLMVLGIMEGILKSIDKIMIAKMLNLELLGYYSIAFMASNFLVQIPNSIGVIMVPHFHEKFGERDNAQDLKNYIEKSTLFFAHAMPVIIGISWILLPMTVRLLLPKYVKGIPAAQCLILSTYVVALYQPYGNFLIAIKKQLWILPITAVVILISALLNLAAIRMHFGIEGVGAATSISLGLYGFAIFIFAGKYLYSSRAILRNGFFILARFGLLLGVLFLLESFVKPSGLYLTTFFRLFIFALACIPIVLSLDRTFQITGYLKEWLSRKKAPQPLAS